MESYGYGLLGYNMMMADTASVANMLLSVETPLLSSTTVHINNCKFLEGKSTSKGGGFMLKKLPDIVIQ